MGAAGARGGRGARQTRAVSSHEESPMRIAEFRHGIAESKRPVNYVHPLGYKTDAAMSTAAKLDVARDTTMESKRAETLHPPPLLDPNSPDLRCRYFPPGRSSVTQIRIRKDNFKLTRRT